MVAKISGLFLGCEFSWVFFVFGSELLLVKFSIFVFNIEILEESTSSFDI